MNVSLHLRQPLRKRKEAVIAVCCYECFLDSSREELTVVVRDDWQDKGIGRALVERVLKIAKKNGMSVIELRIDPQNESSISLFKSMGYPFTYIKPIMWEPYDPMEIELNNGESKSGQSSSKQ